MTRFRRLITMVCSVFSVFQAMPVQAAEKPLAIAEISRSYVRQNVTLQGRVTVYTPPATDRAPHSLMLRDATGVIRIAVWKDVWDQISIATQLKPGADVTLTVQVAEFKGSLEGHLNRPEDVKMGLADPTAAAATPAPGTMKVVSAMPIPWRDDIAGAMTEAKSTQKRVLVLFANPESENNRILETSVLADNRVRAAVQEKYVAVRINLKERPDLASRLGVFRAGVVGLYGSDGTAIRRLDSIRSVEEFLQAIQ